MDKNKLEDLIQEIKAGIEITGEYEVYNSKLVEDFGLDWFETLCELQKHFEFKIPTLNDEESQIILFKPKFSELFEKIRKQRKEEINQVVTTKIISKSGKTYIFKAVNPQFKIKKNEK